MIIILKKITPLFLYFVLLALIFAYFNSTLDTLQYESTHSPSEDMRKEWNKIETLLDKKNDKVRYSINSLLSKLADQEDEVTKLLEHKAATQMGTISIVVAIVLATLRFFLKEVPSSFSINQRNLFLFLNALIVGVFIFSMYWSYQGFAVREDFASYNIENLFDIMNDKESTNHTFLVSDALEHYQIYKINRTVNDFKADALLLAARSFTVGIIGFAMISLGIILLTKPEKYNRGG